MAIVTIASLKAKWITGYKPNQADYVDLFDTLNSIQVAMTQTGGNIFSPDGHSFKINIIDGGIQLCSQDETTANIILDASGITIQGINIPKVYKALISQDGGADAATIVSTDHTSNIAPFINQLSGNPVFSYIGTGHYQLTLVGAFPADKTLLRIKSVLQGGTILKAFAQIEWTSVDTIDIYTYIVSGGASNHIATDGLLNFTAIEIEVYP